MLNISFKSSFGFIQDATASQKNIKSWTTPAGFTVIIWHIPRKALSFSSLSRILRKDVHLQHRLLLTKCLPSLCHLHLLIKRNNNSTYITILTYKILATISQLILCVNLSEHNSSHQCSKNLNSFIPYKFWIKTTVIFKAIINYVTFLTSAETSLVLNICLNL